MQLPHTPLPPRKETGSPRGGREGRASLQGRMGPRAKKGIMPRATIPTNTRQGGRLEQACGCVARVGMGGIRGSRKSSGTSRPVANKESLQHGWQKQRALPHCLGPGRLSSSTPQRSLSTISHPQVPDPLPAEPTLRAGGRGAGLGRENPSPPSGQGKVQASHRSGDRATLWPRCRAVPPVANVAASGDHRGSLPLAGR